MQRTQIYLPKTQIARLKEIARKKDTTTSAVVRIFIQEAMAPKKKIRQRKTAQTLLQIEKRINAIGEKGPKDLAKNMDTYLYGSI